MNDNQTQHLTRESAHAVPRSAPPPARYQGAPPIDAAYARLDWLVHAVLARATAGLSPAALTLAWLDWALHLASSPGKQQLLALRWMQAHTPWTAVRARAGDAGVEQAAADPRFADPGWSHWPFDLLRDAFLQTETFWADATTGLHGVSPHHEQVVSFAARQWVDLLSPANCWWLNPEVLTAAARTGGANFLDGYRHWLEDLRQALVAYAPGTSRQPGDHPRVGRDLAVTPGTVVYRNALIELIQYTPQTATVWREPVLIVPAWIMKYYILDLSPRNSLVRYLVEQGHPVFMISWKNPGPGSRDVGLNDYLASGFFAALDQVRRIVGNAPVHAAGYCLGGTLLAIGAAALERSRKTKDMPLKTITLLAAETDFSEPGELGLFIDASELAYLDALMWQQGYLDGAQMSAAFQLLNSRDLVWSRMMREYLLGQRSAPTDLMAWNADTTRMPYRMHSEYLERLFLRNDLVEGRYCVRGQPALLSDLKMPLFVVGTENDHVSPWRSVYKIHLWTSTEISFLLASGGHNSGVISEPGHPARHYRLRTRAAGTPYLDANEWLAQTSPAQGSWWPHWTAWLAEHSDRRIAPPAPCTDAVLGEAPGTYVFET